MSGPRRSVGPVRQLSLQQPAPRRQQIRRQRSAEDDKSLQIYTQNPISRGRHGTNGKSASERPKVRVAWSENRRKNEKQVEQVEVVARQIPGRSRPPTGRSSRNFGIEKASILYSRQELAERLRLAWKHREENKANIDIFLAHGTVEERCESELSNHPTVTAPSTPLPRKDTFELENSLANGCRITRNDRDFSGGFNSVESLRKEEKEEEEGTISVKTDDECSRNDRVEIENVEVDENESFENNEEKKNEVVDERKIVKAQVEEGLVEKNTPEIKRKTLINIDCTNLHVQSSTLPSIKPEIMTTGASKPKDDFSTAKQKRASFHSGTNRAFLGPIKPSMELRCNSMIEKPVLQRTPTDTKSASIVEKTPAARVVESKDNVNEKVVAPKGAVEVKCNSTIEKTGIQKAVETKSSSTVEKNVTIKSIEDKDGLVNDKTILSRSPSEIRCSSSIEKSVTLRKSLEVQRVDQKSRRTSSAPPHRHAGNSNGSRVQVNIVIDTPGASTNTEKSNVSNLQENILSDRIDPLVSKTSGRSIRSAPLKRRSKSTKRRFFGPGTCKNDEEGKTRNRSSSRGKNSIDSRAIDVVTMVSLVSSADSDSEADNSPGDDKLINELRSKLPTSSIIKTSINPSLSLARKPIKSVSFQRDSFDEDSPKEQQTAVKEEKKSQPRFTIVNNRGNGSNLSPGEDALPWRTDIPGLALPVLALIHDVEETLDVPLTDREKRCLAVPIGELHDKKRRLLRTRSTPSRPGTERQVVPMETKEQESPVRRADIPTQNRPIVETSPRKMEQITTSSIKETDQEVQKVPSEPHFQTSKEKECWHLYRKMCDKGVYVSFDTVLRGMLTPTEYRLRQKELSQDL